MGVAAIFLAGSSLPPAFGQTRTLRIATYNIEDDINGATTPLPGLIAPSGGSVTQGGVLEGIGEEILASDPAQPLDVLALEETTSNPITISPICNGLNSFYNVPGMYTNSNYQGTESGGDVADGNGPNAVVYNAKTLQLVASVPVDPPGGTSQLGSSSGEYREVMRYEFAPAGVAPASSNEFYVYVSHYKSGTGTSNLNLRSGEAVIVRNDASTNLPAGARIIYVGDYNITTSGETSYQTILAATAPNGVSRGQGIDPLNVSDNTGINWGTSTTSTAILAMETESATDLRYRDDLQVVTTNVYYQAPGGLQLVPGTYHTFGNNGTIAYNGTVTSTANTALNTSLTAGAPISASQLRTDLSTASDHFPIVADYTIPIPAPVITKTALAGNSLVLSVTSGMTNGVYTVWMCTNVLLAASNWTAVATNVATGVNFTLTIANAISPAAPRRFFQLQTK